MFIGVCMILRINSETPLKSLSLHRAAFPVLCGRNRIFKYYLDKLATSRGEEFVRACELRTK